MQATVPVSKDGKVTIPKPVRDALDIEKGDMVQIDVNKIQE